MLSVRMHFAHSSTHQFQCNFIGHVSAMPTPFWYPPLHMKIKVKCCKQKQSDPDFNFLLAVILCVYVAVLSQPIFVTTVSLQYTLLLLLQHLRAAHTFGSNKFTYRRHENDSHEFIDSHHHIPHFILSDDPISIKIIHTECPDQLLVKSPVQQGREGLKHILTETTN